MNVVNTGTNILCIHGCHARTNHNENVSCYSCISHHEMNVVNTRTNILYIHGCYTRTNQRKVPAVTHVSHISWKHSFLKTHHQSKPTFRCQKVLQKLHAWLHEDMQHLQLGRMLGLRNVVFSSTFPFTITYISSPY